ncbi:oxygenase MpaB family protein [Streptomyces sp. NPDC051940]|uniref:oxygenase MpaB family protein n=1 Tax=Streptomyces sp. NPDC051940 TaxID=3155675 RepID=UPI00343C2C8A
MTAQPEPQAGPLPHPPFLATLPFRLALRLYAPGDIRATAQQLTAFRDFATAGDPLADAVVAMFRRLPPGRGRALFEQAVEHGIGALPEPPPELVDFFAHVDAVPYWLDPDRLAHGVRTQARTGLYAGVVVLPGLSLYGGYLASRIDKVLLRTGDLESMAPRRLAETATWTTDLVAPGGLDRFGPGFKGILRVRLMHALVRRGLSRRPDWDFAAWDHPVNQIQLAGTLLQFSLMALTGTRALGLRFSARDKAGLFHFWRYIGHVMGIDPRLLPATEADAWRLLWLVAATELQPDEDAGRLAGALLSAMPGYALPARWQRSARARHALTAYVGSYSRLVLGKDNADRLGAPDSKAFQAAVLATTALTFGVETLRRLTPGGTRLAARVGYLSIRRMVDRGMRDHHGDLAFDRHDRLPGAA